MFHWFKKKEEPVWMPAFTTDVHSHLLPGIDDGVKSLEEAEQVIVKLQSLGFSRLITSPHVHELYRNSTETILEKLTLLKDYLKEKKIEVTLSSVAEYSLDEWLMQQVEAKTPLLTFSQNHLLFETNFFSEPLILNDFIFKITTLGYKPVMAHPERYMYLLNNKSRIEDLAARGVLMQLNTMSLAGLYGPEVEKLARFLIDQKFVNMLGSDCHNLLVAEVL
ncbi:MAG: capsular biosynthesis protein [Cyclobacteriaceae bacterium]|nr:capsular biosynthesis protein [Cyclobacteriaceae bacterium]